MVDRNYAVTLPDYVVEEFGWEQSEAPLRIREALIMELLRLDRISEADAAASLGMDRWELLETMGRYKVPAIRLTPDELKAELTKVVDLSVHS